MEPTLKPSLPWSIKICGITRVVDAVAAVKAGADAIGLNFFTRSLRFVQSETASTIVQGMESWKVIPVGVFVNHSSDAIREIATATGIRWVQLHGLEQPSLADELGELNIVRVVRVGSAEDFLPAFEEAQLWSAKSNVRAILIDSPIRCSPGDGDEPADGTGFGGTGQTADWDASLRLVETLELPVVLAGGLNADNVGAAIAMIRPAAVDVASGVEGLPGQKHPGKLNQFITSARTAYGLA